MSQFRFLLAALLLASAALPGAAMGIEPPSDQDRAYEKARNGQIRSFGEIRSRVSTRIRGRFLGCDCDPGAARYRMKYLRDGEVVVVDVDARTGNILGMQH